MLRYKTKLDPV